jgi:hypothetical protein
MSIFERVIEDLRDEPGTKPMAYPAGADTPDKIWQAVGVHFFLQDEGEAMVGSNYAAKIYVETLHRIRMVWVPAAGIGFSEDLGDDETAYEFTVQLVGSVVAMTGGFAGLERDPAGPAAYAQAENFSRTMLEEWFATFIAWSVLDYRGRFPN